MKNRFLSERTTADIDKQVAKVLHGLGNPSPPISLDDVRQLLRLDRQFYTTTDHGALREIVNRIKIAGKQILERPMLLADAIKAWDLKALYLPDRKRILIDGSQPEAKWRWSEGHEITHSIVEWHQPLMLGDNKLTLTPTCHDQIEAEANYGAGRLLFLRDKILEMVRGSTPGIALVQQMSKIFNNTLTSTLWTYVEQSSELLFGAVCSHPHHLPANFDEANPCRYFIRSRSFASSFSNVLDTHVFRAIASYCGRQKGGPLETSEVVFHDDNGVAHVFRLETFSNTYEVLTLGVHCRPKPIAVGR